MAAVFIYRFKQLYFSHMALTRQQKEQKVTEAQTHLKSASSVVFMTYNALGVSDSEELRSQLFEAGIRMRVIPKRLLSLAANNLNLELDCVHEEGQIAFLWSDDDVIAPAKTLQKFAKKHDNVVMVGGIMEGRVLTRDEVDALAKLPGLTELRGQLVGTIANPLRGFVTVLSGTQRGLVQVLQSIADSKKDQTA
jgi:large subunit ribosomal protein L10